MTQRTQIWKPAIHAFDLICVICGCRRLFFPSIWWIGDRNQMIRLLSISIAILSCFAAGTNAPTAEPPKMYVLEPVSGADGEFERVKEGDETILRSLKTPDGFASHIYFRLPDEARGKKGAAYLEVTYQDVGVGRIAVEYDCEGPDNPYRRAETGFNRFLGGTGRTRTAVFRLPDAGFHQRENLQADLRLCSPSREVGLNVVGAVLSFEPTPRFLEREAMPWLQPYGGPTRNDVDATTLHHKVLCGYQGWFRCPGDPADQGWKHWSGNQNRIDPETVTVEMWPDLTEWKADETYRAPGFRNADGSAAVLFSSVDSKTVEHHFDWMKTYDIDGVFAQRFLVNVGDPSFDRVLGLVRDNANRTGRAFGVCYDLSGMSQRRVFERLETDWKRLVDEWKLTEDSRYLHENGKPVVFLWGFYPDRFGADLANRLLDIFQKGGRYEATVIGGCPWYWRNEKDAAWAAVLSEVRRSQPVERRQRHSRRRPKGSDDGDLEGRPGRDEEGWKAIPAGDLSRLRLAQFERSARPERGHSTTRRRVLLATVRRGGGPRRGDGVRRDV